MIPRILPISRWPETDRLAWSGAIAEGDVFSRGPAARWAPTTQFVVCQAYGRWLGFLAASEPLALAEDPAGRLNDARLAAYVDNLAKTAGSVGRHMYVEKLRSAFRVMFTREPPVHLSRLVTHLRGQRRPRSKAASIVYTPRLTTLGITLMRESIRPDGEIGDHVRYRDGLMIAILSKRPIRRRTFSLIRIGHHMRHVGDETRLVFDRAETKSGRPLQITVPPRLLPFLERFLREVRPKFNGADEHDALWPSLKGKPLSVGAISRQVTARTRGALGLPLGPHRFRDCAATTLAMLAPEKIGIARDLLEHVSLSTTNAHYIQARSIEASRRYANVVAALLQDTRRRSR